MTADSQSQPYDTRDESGEFVAKYGEGDILEAVRKHDPAGTTEVAEAVGCTRQSADYRLRRLEDDGKVRSKKVGRSLVWMFADEQA